MKTVTAIRVISDYRRYEKDYGSGEKGPFVNYFIVPGILSVSEVSYKPRWGRGMYYWDERAGKKGYVEPFEISLCLGSELTAKTVTLSFSTKARAEVCQDDILEAIDEYWTKRIRRED